MGTIQIDGATPKLTIGNATAEDATILFDGNAQDFYIALDDSADDLLIGLGSSVGTTPVIAIDENKLSTFSGAVTVGVDDTGHDVKFFGATASSYMLWDESADDLNLIASGIGVIAAKDLGTGIHIKEGDSGASVSGNADLLVLECAGTAPGMTFLSHNTEAQHIHFGDPEDNDIGMMSYYHGDNSIRFVTNATEAMRIDSSGTLFVGATSSSGYNGAVWQDPDGISIHRTNATGGNGVLLIYSDDGGAKTNKGYWKVNGGVVNFQSNDTDLSDERLKKNIVDTPSTWETIKELKVRNFKYKTDSDSVKTHIGLIAQETEAIDSTLVNTTDGLYGFEEEQENTVKEANGTVIATSVEEDDWIQGKTDGIYPSDSTWTENEKYRQIYNKDLYFKMLKALQEAITKIETLETKVTALENA